MGININRVSLAGLVVALGIIYGDIGTSPLYVFKAIVGGNPISDLLVIGGISCIIWTLTLQTTVKYVILTLRADNKGEGGIFSLYALVRRHARWAVIFGMIGGAALLADGIITPPITVTSAIEGLRTLEVFKDLGQMTIVKIVLTIITGLFVMQQFGTISIGKLFGPIMVLWFSMLGILGISHIADDISIFKAFSPHYAIELLTTYPKGFLILGAVFLCTTGAEALYSDLGHCGRGNIRIYWIFVKSCLILNYLGQGAWLLIQKGQILPKDQNPFFTIMREWFVIFGVLIATMASIIASQALISGSFTLIAEAMRLNLWPKMRVNYPTEMRGQLYIPGINTMLFVGCAAIVMIFQESSNMEAAYGLSITICMLMTSCLFAFYLYTRRVWVGWILLYLVVYFTIEFSFLFANVVKFMHGGYVTVIVAGGLLSSVGSPPRWRAWSRSHKVPPTPIVAATWASRMDRKNFQNSRPIATRGSAGSRDDRRSAGRNARRTACPVCGAGSRGGRRCCGRSAPAGGPGPARTGRSC